MAKRTKKSEVVEVPVLEQESSITFEYTKDMLAEIHDQVIQIKVTDSTSLSVANQKMSFVNNHLKEIEAKRKELKQPFIDGGKKIDETAKELSGLLEPALKHLKSEVATWQTEVLRKENELKQKALEEARKKEEEAKSNADEARIISYISQVKDWLEKGLSSCSDVAHGEQMVSSMKGLQPASVMGKYSQEYGALVEMYNTLFTTKIGELKGTVAAGTTNSHIEVLGGQLNDHIDSIKKEVEQKQQELTKVEEEIVQEVAKLEEQKASNVAFIWKFDVVSPENVPSIFMTIDEKKIREWMNANKDNLKDGETIYGIKFFKEASVRTK